MIKKGESFSIALYNIPSMDTIEHNFW